MSNNRNGRVLQDLGGSQHQKDQSDAAADASPVLAERMWEHQAETMHWSACAGRSAGPQAKLQVLQTVVNNLLLTNSIDLPIPKCVAEFCSPPLWNRYHRHTIVLSRGPVNVCSMSHRSPWFSA